MVKFLGQTEQTSPHYGNFKVSTSVYISNSVSISISIIIIIIIMSSSSSSSSSSSTTTTTNTTNTTTKNNTNTNTNIHRGRNFEVVVMRRGLLRLAWKFDQSIALGVKKIQEPRSRHNSWSLQSKIWKTINFHIFI